MTDLSSLPVEAILLELKKRFEVMVFAAKEPCEWMSCDKTLSLLQGELYGVNELCDIIRARVDSLANAELDVFEVEEDEDEEDCAGDEVD